jgi:hypothetical protein
MPALSQRTKAGLKPAQKRGVKLGGRNARSDQTEAEDFVARGGFKELARRGDFLVGRL